MAYIAHCEAAEARASSRNWIIQKVSNTRMGILIGSSAQGEIVMQKDLQWKVSLMRVSALEFTGSLERCIGYVRGVENCLKVYEVNW